VAEPASGGAESASAASRSVSDVSRRSFRSIRRVCTSFGRETPSSVSDVRSAVGAYMRTSPRSTKRARTDWSTDADSIAAKLIPETSVAADVPVFS
jgi:hypothetical protein